MRIALALLGLASLGAAQNQPPKPVDPALLAVGRQLVAQLKMDQTADTAVFQQVGTDRAMAAMMAVMNRGQEVSATPQEWKELHRAIDGLIELDIGKGELFRAAVFSNFQEIYYRQDEGDYTAALTSAHRSLDLQERSGQTTTLYICWKNLGEDLLHLGRVEEGLDALYHAHRIIDDPVSSTASLIWREIVDGEIARKNLPAAQRECAAFAQQAEAASGAEVFRGSSWLARADVAMEEGRYSDAVDSVRSAIQALATSKEKDLFGYECASELASLGVVAMDALPYTEAMALMGRIDREFPTLPFSMSAFARQSMVHRRRLAGDYEGLLREDTDALEKARKEKDVRGQIRALTSLAVTYSYANSASQQITLLEEALGLDRSLLPPSGIPDNAAAQDEYFRLLTMMGDAYAGQKNVGSARKCFNEVTRGIDALPEAAAKTRLAARYGAATLGKALVAELDDDPDTAREILARALTAKPGGPAKYTRSDVLLQAARLERGLNEKPLDAVRYYEEAIQETHAARDARTEISLRLQLARYFAVEAANKVPDAQTRAVENLQLAEGSANAIEFADALWRVRFLQGIVAQTAGKRDEAIDLYIQSAGRLDRLRAGLPQQEQRQAFMDNESIQELYQRLVALLSASGRPAEAWEYLERGKARAFLEGLQGRRFRQPAQLADRAGDLENIDRKIVDLRSTLSGGGEMALRGSGREPALMQAELQNLEARFAALRQEEAMVSSRASQPLALRPIAFEEARKTLPPHTALVEYAVLDGSLTAFIASAAGTRQLQWPANTRTLASAIVQLRDQMSAANTAATLEPMLKQISALLVAPVAKAIPAGTTRLWIVPAQALYYVPFQALYLPDGRAMIDEYAISYLPSASTLQYLKPGSHRPSSDLFLGALGNVSVEGWAPLPGTLVETAGIAESYPRAERAIEKDFTHDRAIRALEEHDQVHFATHGKYEDGAPLFSAIFTAPQPGGPLRLSLYEVMNLKLRARLVVLSACETDKGKLSGGDEIAGLTRTFLLAGADTVVSSLWQVSDESTAMLMQGFYRRLREGESTAEALRESALEVRKRFPHPFYWAPFIETGID